MYVTKTCKLLKQKQTNNPPQKKPQTFTLSVRIEQVISLLRLIEKPFMKLVIHNFNKYN